MWQNLTHLSVTPIELIIRAGGVLFFVLFLLRVSGKRQLGQMGAIELVAILLISNAVQNAMNAGDNSLVGGLILATVLIFLSWLISLLSYHFPKMSLIFEGRPTLLIHKGELLKKNLAKERMTRNELRVLLRHQGIESIREVQSAILEANGQLSVFRFSEQEKPV